MDLDGGSLQLCKARLRIVITTSIHSSLRRPVDSTLYCSHDYQKRLRQLDFKVSPLNDASIVCRAVNE